jgi:transcriptional regulator with XRE-family HTH domain
VNFEDLLEHVSLVAVSTPNSWSKTPPADLLRALRRARGISQRHLAEMSGVDQSVISGLEHGADGRWSTWERLFSVLGFRAVPLPVSASDETDDLIRREIADRKERIEEGRLARWR